MQVEKIRSNCYAAAVGVLLTVSSQAALAQSDSQAWVSDELSTYVRSGPTDGYRIVGTLNAGEQVEVVKVNGIILTVARPEESSQPMLETP